MSIITENLLLLLFSLFLHLTTITHIPLPPQDIQRRLRVDREFVREVVMQHVAVNMFPATAFQPGLVYTVNGMGGTFDVKMTRSNALTVSRWCRWIYENKRYGKWRVTDGG